MMTTEEILSAFNDCEKGFPTEAVASALEQTAAITPLLLAILENVVNHPETVNYNQMDYIFALYLLAKFRETQALPWIISLAALPGDLPEKLLGDCITESLARFIVSTCEGDITNIIQLIENTQANLWSRNAALHSLVGLVAVNRVERDTLIHYLRGWFHAPLAQDKDFVTSLVNVASDLYPEELLPEINHAFDKGQVDLEFVNQKWIQRILAQGKEVCLATRVYKNRHHLPIEEVEEEMNWMAAFQQNFTARHDDQEAEDMNDFWDTDLPKTYYRDGPKVGRNQFCPCGSGKKFKKCCLQ